MSRRAKAELEAENAELLAENKSLKRHVEIQAEQIRDLLDGANWDQYKLKITDKAHEESITKHIDYRNVVDPKLKKSQKGQETKAKAEAERKEYFRDRFVIHQPGSKNKKEACQKADKDTNNEFPDMDPYKSGSWYSVVKGL